MSIEERSADDAVYVLRAVARLMRISPYKDEDPNWTEMHAEYLEDIAGAVARDANLDSNELEAGAKYVGSEWENALSPVFYGRKKVKENYVKIQEIRKQNR